MTYALVTQSFGSAYANQQVQISDSTTGAPAIVQSSATGGVISTQGFATLDGSGNLSVYLDNSHTWTIQLARALTGQSTSRLAETLLTDSNSVLFLARDDGSTISYVRVDNGATYIPQGTIAAAGGGGGGASSVTVTSSVLPTGAATAANQATQITAEQAIASNQGTTADAAVVAGAAGSVSAKLRQISGATGDKADSAATDSTSSWSLTAIMKGLYSLWSAATFKASSTAAVATDKPLVVALHPSSNTPNFADNTIAATTVNAANVNLIGPGAATAGSTVGPLTLNGASTVTVHITANTLGANMYPQISDDNTNWISLAETGSNVSAGSWTNLFSSAVTGIFKFNVGGSKYFRVSANSSGVTGSATVTLNAGNGVGVTQSTVNLTHLNGTGLVTGGVSGVLSVGGNAAAGSTTTANPLPMARDAGGLARYMILDNAGGLMGPGEILQSFSLGTGAAAVTDGTNGKVIYLTPQDHEIYLSFITISTTPTAQLEGSVDGVNFSIIPLTRIDTNAASLQYTSLAAFTPGAGQMYRGRSYGFPIIRVHLTAGTTSPTTGSVRCVPLPVVQMSQTESFFTLNAASTTEAVGTANGQVQVGGVRTLAIASPGSAKAILHLEAVTGTMTLKLEGSTDGSSYQILGMQPVGGGAPVVQIAATGTTALPQGGVYEADLSNYNYVRVHCTAYTSGNAFGNLKIVNLPRNERTGRTFNTYSATGQVALAASATDVFGLTGSAALTIYVTRIVVSGVQTTAGVVDMQVIKRSTANTGGTTNALTAVPHDSNNGGASSTVVTYTANPTGLGTAVGTVRRKHVYVPAAATAGDSQGVVFDFGDKGQPIVLHAATQSLVLNMNGVTVTGGTLNITVEWYEA